MRPRATPSSCSRISVTRSSSSPIPDDPQGGRLVFAYGTGTVHVSGGTLVMDARAEDADSLARVQDVLTRHLVRFGARRELEVTWSAPPDRPGSTGVVTPNAAGAPAVTDRRDPDRRRATAFRARAAGGRGRRMDLRLRAVRRRPRRPRIPDDASGRGRAAVRQSGRHPGRRRRRTHRRGPGGHRDARPAARSADLQRGVVRAVRCSTGRRGRRSSPPRSAGRGRTPAT